MASLIKNQLVKHLSKFTRNLKPEQISLDVLKGKSKLQFIEINEEVLTDILELPAWLKIQRAYCTGVTVSVPWTKLKSAPVQIFIDEICVDVVLEGGETVRKNLNAFKAFAENASYGFVDKVVEGMSLYISTVEINFDSDAFGGSFMLQRLSVESRTPAWQPAADLRQTRISCPTTNRTLIFKQISWHLLRVEASAKSERTEKRSSINAPLRLITSGGRIRISLKKHSGDGTVIHARILMILEDILWVATLPQLRSALAFYSYILSLVKTTVGSAPQLPPPPSKPPTLSADQPSGATPSSNIFKAFDFDQTSHHLHVTKIDLHLCDDAHANSCYPPEWNIESGAMQVTLHWVLIDIYPKTLATSDRSHWLRYTAPNAFTQWINSRLESQLKSIVDTLDDTGKTRLTRCWPQLMSFNVVVRVFDLSIQCVSEPSTKKDALLNLFTSERLQRSVPKDQYIVHFEFANFFHPMSDTLPVPSPASYLQLGPFSLLFDRRTLRWCLYVAHNLTSALDLGEDFAAEPIPHSDIKIDLLMPKIIIPLPDPSSDRRLPHRLITSFSTISISNCNDCREVPLYSQLSQALLGYCQDLDLLGGKDLFCSDAGMFNSGSNIFEVLDQFWISTSPAWVDTDHGNKTKPLPVVSDVCFSGTFTIRRDQVNVYVEPTTAVMAAIDHFQFLQLTRFIADISDFVDLLTRDQAHYQANGEETPAPTIVVLAAVRQVRANIILTMGALPSPFDRVSTMAENNSMLDILSEANGTRSNTPRRVHSAYPIVPEEHHRTAEVEEFPEFPPAPQEYDASAYIDETMSIATSIEDESTFDFEMNPEDDLYPTADLAEEAAGIDEEIINDRMYKALMAKNGNSLSAEINNVIAVVNVFNKDTRVLGKADSASLSYQLNVSRQVVYDSLKTKQNLKPLESSPNPQVRYKVDTPATSSTAFVNVNVTNLSAKLDDEVVSHLAAFALDEQVAENKVRLKVEVQDSAIEIRDRKKKKPMRIKIKEVVIEQDEDARTDTEE